MQILFVTLQSGIVNGSDLAIGDFGQWNFNHIIIDNYCPCASVVVVVRILTADESYCCGSIRGVVLIKVFK
jgi:hypothetical protein